MGDNDAYLYRIHANHSGLPKAWMLAEDFCSDFYYVFGLDWRTDLYYGLDGYYYRFVDCISSIFNNSYIGFRCI